MKLRTSRQMLGVKSADEYQVKLLKQSQALGIPIVEDPATLVAYVNEGRLVADCPYCSGGIALSTDYETAACLDCCHVYSTVTWPEPEELRQIEAALLVRPLRNQNWTPGETVDTLKAENIEHGIGDVKGQR